jgi:GNAT superfamily N-acetyltransferase
METLVEIIIVEEGELTAEQKTEMLLLQKQCFSDVSAEEIEEDFCRPTAACALAYDKAALIACVELFEREIEHKEQTVKIGGFSPCTKEDLRGKGIGTEICKAAMDYLKRRACAIAFLSVDTKHDTHLFYEKLGFRMLANPFVYKNVRGEPKQSDGGMIAPLGESKLFEEILREDKPLSLAPEIGYW